MGSSKWDFKWKTKGEDAFYKKYSFWLVVVLAIGAIVGVVMLLKHRKGKVSGGDDYGLEDYMGGSSHGDFPDLAGFNEYASASWQ